MSLTLYMHPLSSFCHKVLIALYENATPFTPHPVDLANPAEREAFKRVWPIGKFPVLQDAKRNRVVPESTMIIEYLARHYPGVSALIPHDEELAWQVRAMDRLCDLHLHDPMQRVVADKLRPVGHKDPLGVEQAWERIRTTLQLLEQDVGDKQWWVGEQFTMAECAAAPPLFFIDKMKPLGADYPRLHAYLRRLQQRACYARVLDEAEPYMAWFPG